MLASGAGKRFDASGRQSKLLAPLGSGGTVIGAALQSLLGVGCDVYVVAPVGSLALRSALEGASVRWIDNPRAMEGMSSSIAVGVAALGSYSGCLVALADMPYIEPATVKLLVAALKSGAHSVAPAYNGTRGHPVGFSRVCFDELRRLYGDEGARSVLARHPPLVIETNDSGILRDIDTIDDLPN